MTTWATQPLFERKEGKKVCTNYEKKIFDVVRMEILYSFSYISFYQDTLLNLDEWQERTNKRYGEINETADRINVLLRENMELFNMQDNQDSEIWLSYVAFIDGLIEETLFKSIACRYQIINV